MAERAATELLGASPPGEVRVRRALLSVSDKTGIAEFARGLAGLGVELVSTGGTARALAEAGLEVRAVEDFTGFPEMMDGRVKTLHPRLYAGLLAVRDSPEHVRAAHEHGIEPVDLVCVNLYPFERTIASGRASDEEAIENIDIGGPTMIRAAAKNHAYAVVVVRPQDYGPLLEELRADDGRVSLATRRRLAHAAFATTARYDAAISGWFAEGLGEDLPEQRAIALERVMGLRYGENPHQAAAYYARAGAPRHLLSGVEQHQGKELSFNNLLDLSSARELAEELPDRAACAIVKHNNPCGFAVAATALEAYQRAFACDPVSAFGGVIALNRPVDRELAEAISGQFLEVLLAPGFDAEALEVFAAKPNVRLLDTATAGTAAAPERLELKPVLGGMLVQDRDAVTETRAEMTLAEGTRAPSEREWEDLELAWRVCRHVRSNAIVLVRDGATIGIGAGQMSRVDSVRIAVEKAREHQPQALEGAALASDAYFPFADGPELALEAGIAAIIQPGGSIRDAESVAAASSAGAAMVMTGRRHFRH
jgi:phosphoribosylaminoimidazolecarboxamide formyltransferase / IMP cyclohydrolase